MGLRRLAKYRPLRRIALRVLRAWGTRDIVIRHHWWSDVPLRLNAYKHRGYWFKGKQRERRVMEKLAELAKPGDTVVEIGAHIGYLSVHLGKLVGDDGTVVVFEPGSNNLPYLQENTERFSNIEIVEAACGDRDGPVEFWIEPLSGQNNSLDRNYKNFQVNRENAFSDAVMESVTVEMMQLDTFLAEKGLRPALLKIDVEGAEDLVLRGSARCLADIRPVVVVEVTENSDDVASIFEAHNYAIHDRSHPEWICVPTEKVNALRAAGKA
ncbi:FkbM family methyltransferase [Rhizobium sp. 007]|uniref:FkbM family methyltransferase n=1 Tax=Rhizobium sp. 007 TaxID=2785056 RepID=UPI0018907B2C|nr:FkbM family methyltransferase [Rhizobium sp. 007]QPB23296.1 FkbM family methyltransferase [Rhizobium sp. 007]